MEKPYRSLWLALLVFFLLAFMPLDAAGIPENTDESLRVEISDPKGVLPENITVEVKQKTVTSADKRQVKKELNSLEDGQDGSFVTQRYENTSLKEMNAVRYDVTLVYEEDGQKKEYVPTEEDGVGFSFSLKNEDFSSDTKELDVFDDKGELIRDRVSDKDTVHIKAREDGSYLLVSAEYVAKATTAEKREALAKIQTMLEKVDPVYFTEDSLAYTYTADEFAVLKGVADGAVVGCSTDGEKIRALATLVATHTYYDLPYVQADEPLTALNPYDVWMKQVSVCDGYSRLMETLSFAEDIPCFRIYSDDHAYNACYDGDAGRWVVLDTTWASGNTYTLNHEKINGSCVASYLDMSMDFMSRLSNHEVFSLEGIRDDEVYYVYYPNHTATNWSNMDWDTWTNLSDWYLGVCGIASGKNLTADTDFYCGLPVTDVVSSAFYGEDLSSVSLPSSLQTIGTGAFRGNTSLLSVTVAGSKPLDIGPRAFYGDSALTSVDIGSRKLGTVGVSAFENDKMLSTFGDNLLEMENVDASAFRECNALADPVKVTGSLIESQVFYNCSSLPSADLSKASAESVGTYLFRGCGKMTRASLPSAVTAIPAYCFYGCEELESVSLPLTQITTGGQSAFYNCYQLTEPFDWSVAPMEVLPTSFFRNNTGRVKLILPDSLKEIGYASLAGCTKLSALDLSNTQLTKVGEYGCYNLSKVTSFRFPVTLISSASNAYQKTGDGLVDTYVEGVTDHGVLSYTADNKGAWLGRTVHFGPKLCEAVFVNGETRITLSCPSGETVEAPAMTETKDYYTFEGWKAEDGSLMTAGTDVFLTNQDVPAVYTASWRPKEYSISYELNGGSNHPDNPSVYTVESGMITLSDPIKGSSVFEGWYLNDTTKITQIDSTKPENIVLYARWACDHPHTEIRNRREATCLADGYTGDTYCTDCVKKIGTGSVIPKTAHQWDKTEGREEATCIKAGHLAYWHCSVCKKYYGDANGSSELSSIVLPKANASHDLSAHAKVPASCTAEGMEAYWECGLCHKLFSDSKGKTVISAPVRIPKTEHQFDAGVVTAEPTCMKEGSRRCTCTVCHATETVKIPKTAHDAVGHAAVASTCTKQGTAAYWECSMCHQLFSDASCTKKISSSAVLPLAAHRYGNWIVAKDASCTATGQKERVCSVCGKKETASVSAKGHTAVYYAAIAATESAEGRAAYYECSRCHKLFSDAGCTKEINGPAVLPKRQASLLSPELKVTNKKIKCSYKKLKKKTQKISAKKIVKGNSSKTGITYRFAGINKSKKKFKKYFKISAGGTLVLKKGLKKGTYKISVLALTKPASGYTAMSKRFLVTIVVK